METTRINRDIGRVDNGSGALHLMSEAGRTAIIPLLEQLKRDLGDAVWVMPPESLHITLCELYQDKPYKEDKEVLFMRNEAQYKTALTNVLEHRAPINVRFDRVSASPDAVILRGSGDEEFNAIRDEITETLPIPEDTKVAPDIVHTSIARFVREIDMDIVRAAVMKLQISFVERVDEFQLIHNCSPHVAHYEIAGRFPLGG